MSHKYIDFVIATLLHAYNAYPLNILTEFYWNLWFLKSISNMQLRNMRKVLHRQNISLYSFKTCKILHFQTNSIEVERPFMILKGITCMQSQGLMYKAQMYFKYSSYLVISQICRIPFLQLDQFKFTIIEFLLLTFYIVIKR